MSLKSNINPDKLPLHVAVIMDGNGRWAYGQGKERVFGHKNGVSAVRNTVEACAEIGVKFLTLYTFSTENWNRPKNEVDALMQLLVLTIRSETETLIKNDIRLTTIGDLSVLPGNCIDQLNEAIEITRNNKRMTLTLALSYSSRWEIVTAVQDIVKDAIENKVKVEDISEQYFSSMLQTREMPDPELIIRTSGEYRISNFLLWQIAYAEFHFTNKLWPDFDKDDLYTAILDFQSRERRFGKTSDQIKIN